MAKKSKKARRPNIPMYTGPVTAAAVKSTVTVTPAAAAPARREALSADYTYVVKDLKRIGILAGAFIGAMVAASFFVR